MDRTEKIDCRENGAVIFTGATIKFQLKKGLTGFPPSPMEKIRDKASMKKTGVAVMGLRSFKWIWNRLVFLRTL